MLIPYKYHTLINGRNYMEIKQLELSKLIPDPNNARKHDDKNLDSIKGSLVKFGQQHPIIIDKNYMVLAGNGRLEAAKSLGWETIACVVSDLETITEKTAFALADNRTAELATWDDDILKETLQGLKDDDFELGDIGFDIDDLIAEHDLSDLPDDEKEKKFFIEIEFFDDETMKEEYENILSRGLIAKIKS